MVTDTISPSTLEVWQRAPRRFRHGKVAMGPTQLSAFVYLSKTWTRYHLLRLVDAGLVEKVPQGPYRNLYAGKREKD